MRKLTVQFFSEALSRRSERPVISADCGAEGRLFDHNRTFHAHPDTLGIQHHYAEELGNCT